MKRQIRYNRYVVDISKKLYYFAFILTLVAVLSSLYLSEIAHLLPCVLCWYQRILLFPLVFIFPVGILKKDSNLPLYVLPLSITGVVVSLYHVLLQEGIIPATILPCQAGVSCATKYIIGLGFITIPLLSLLTFVLITLCMVLSQKHNKI